MTDELALVPVEPAREMVRAMANTLETINLPNYCPVFAGEMEQTYASALSAVPARYALIREKELAVIEAAEKRIHWGHSDTCATALFTDTNGVSCDCGHERLRGALITLRQAKGTET